MAHPQYAPLPADHVMMVMLTHLWLTQPPQLPGAPVLSHPCLLPHGVQHCRVQADGIKDSSLHAEPAVLTHVCVGARPSGRVCR